MRGNFQMEFKERDLAVIKKTEELPKNAWALGYFHSSHEDWDGETWVRNLHELQIRDLTLFTLGEVKDKRVLDVGCGSGEYMATLAKMGAQVFGQDMSYESTVQALAVLREEGFAAEVKVGDATKLLFDDNYFDAVFSADFFEHINHEQKNRVIKEVYRVLKPGGTFTIKTPNLNYLRISILFKRICAIFTFKSPFLYIAHTHNNPDNQHIGLTTHQDLEKLLIDNIFHFQQITYIHLIRKNLPLFITDLLYGKKLFTEQVIITSRKPLFYSLHI